MKRTLSRTQRARCPPGAGRGGDLSACRGGGPTACPTAVPRRRVKRAGYWGVRNYAEAAALGIPRPMRRSYRATRSARGSGRPGFFLPWGPDPEDPDSDGLVLPEVDRLPGVEEPATRRTTASAPAEAGTPRPDESPGRTAGPPSGRPPAGYGPAASGTYAPTHFATGISASCEGCHLDRDRPRPPAS